MSIYLAEKILLEKFQQEPFHNFYLLNNIQPTTTKFGGTCSDKALSYLKSVKTAGLKAYLHTARIGGEEIHQLVRLEINNQRYFADVGNGWPSIQLYPAFKPVLYECYGMRFRTTIENNVLKIFHFKRGVEKLQMEIDIKEKSEKTIQKSIARRFSSGVVYPFSNQLRFSMVVDQRFLFIRNTTLEIYSNNYYEEVPHINITDLKKIIMTYFKYDAVSLKLESLYNNMQGN